MSVPWYEQDKLRDELLVFGRAIQGIAPYEVVIEPDPTGCLTGSCSFNLQKIRVNPVLFDAPDIEQLNLTKALLVHEAGHKRYSTPSTLPPIVSQIANILEDERVERKMWQEFIGARWLIKMLAARFYQEVAPIDYYSDNPKEVVLYFLRLRWARRIGQPIKGGLSTQNQKLWWMVEQLVYESWEADCSETVDRNAAKIAEGLNLKQDSLSNY